MAGTGRRVASGRGRSPTALLEQLHSCVAARGRALGEGWRVEVRLCLEGPRQRCAAARSYGVLSHPPLDIIRTQRVREAHTERVARDCDCRSCVSADLTLPLSLCLSL